MKIAYFVNQYPGISHSFIRREIQALERRGVDVERFAIRPAADPVFSDEDTAEAAKTRHIVTASKSTLFLSICRTLSRRPLGALRAFADAMKHGRCSEAGLFRHLLYFGEALVLADWMANASTSHVHAHFGTNAAMIAMLATRLGDVSYSVTVHGPEEFEKPAAIALREKVERAAFVIAISQYGAAQLKKLTAPAAWAKIKIVHCGVEKDFFEVDAVAPPKDARFVCVGRLCAEKGQIDLIHAVKKVRARIPGISLSLIGDGPMRPAIEAAIEESGLGSAVSVDGWKSPTDVRAAILGARAFVLPSYAEGLPVSIMEALSLRRPVISTYIAGIPELIANGGCGWLTPAGDVEAIAAAMEAAARADDAALTAMAEEGFRRVTARHDIDREVAKLARHFEDAVETRA